MKGMETENETENKNLISMMEQPNKLVLVVHFTSCYCPVLPNEPSTNNLPVPVWISVRYSIDWYSWASDTRTGTGGSFPGSVVVTR